MISRYETLTGRHLDVSILPAQEKRAFRRLLEQYKRAPKWGRFSSVWQRVLSRVLSGVAPKERTQHVLYRIGQDLEMRLGIAQGAVAPPDYRDRIADEIREKFGTRYKFCKATGIPEPFLSQVLSGKKNFSLEKLREVCEALGLELVLMPASEVRSAAKTLAV